MKLGLISDTHGNVARTRNACNILATQQIAAVLHCGDLGSDGVLIEMAAAFDPEDVPVYAVLGNVDHYNSDVTDFCADVKVSILGAFGRLKLGGKTIALVHGDDGRRRDYAATCGEFDYVFTGHTHVAADERIGNTRIINPGAVYRSAEPSVAVLDLETDMLTYLGLR